MPELKEMVKKVDNTKSRHPEERQYLICIRGKDGAEDEWDIVIGRTAAYEYIKERIEYIDMMESFILVEHLALLDRKSIYAFMQYVQDRYEDGFDINDYIKGDFDETDYKEYNDIPVNLEVDNNDRLSMEEIMNGSVQATPLD